MVKFGLTVFYLFGLPANFLAFQFSYYLVFRIRPYGSTSLIVHVPKSLIFLYLLFKI